MVLEPVVLNAPGDIGLFEDPLPCALVLAGQVAQGHEGLEVLEGLPFVVNEQRYRRHHVTAPKAEEGNVRVLGDANPSESLVGGDPAFLVPSRTREGGPCCLPAVPAATQGACRRRSSPLMLSSQSCSGPPGPK